MEVKRRDFLHLSNTVICGKSILGPHVVARQQGQSDENLKLQLDIPENLDDHYQTLDNIPKNYTERRPMPLNPIILVLANDMKK